MAGVTPIFSQDGKTATFLLSGQPGDPDAPGIWNVLVTPPESFQGKLAKRLEALGPGGEKAFDVDCVFSNVIQNFGTCTVILHEVPGMIEVDKAAGRARMWVSGDTAAGLARQFSMREGSTILFR